jgi:DNA polymerase-3 subunit delta
LTSAAAKTTRFTFICGQDDYLVDRLGRERFGALARDADEFSRETISGFAGNIAEVAAAVGRLRESVQTLPMFGGRRVVWFKDVNFLADTVTGRAEGTLRLVEDLQEILERVKPEEAAVIVSAAPVDRRRSFAKWCEKNADFVLVEDQGADAGALEALAYAEAHALGASFEPGALDLLLAKIGPNARLLVEEVRKLAAYADGAPVREADVIALSPNAAGGDFFETAEAFFSGDLKWTLAALQRHFFAGGDARPILAALQNRNRLLLQVRALLDAGQARGGPRGIDDLARASEIHRAKYGEAAGARSAFNVFSQNAWYLGKLASAPRLPTVKRLIDNQREFLNAFEEIIRRPDGQEEVLRDMTARCLA